jgi:hypothetical protein
MAKGIIGKPPGNPDEDNKKLNLSANMYGFADPAFREGPGDENNPGPDENEDKQDSSDSTIFGEGWVDMVAPTTNPTFPRALVAGYNAKLQLMVIVFRPPASKSKNGVRTYAGPGSKKPWIIYTGVSEDTWNTLSQADSTGTWLKRSGVENNNYYRVSGDDKPGLKKLTNILVEQGY